MQIKIFRIYIILLIFFSCLFAAFTVTAQHKNELSLDSLINHHLQQAKMAGLAGAVIVNNQIVWMKGYGFADIANKIPFTPNTITNVGSIAKTVTGACMMRLVQEKKLSLDEDINVYLPFKVKNPHFPNESITLRMISTHSSSLADRYPFYTDSLYVYGNGKREALGDFLKNYFVPGGTHYTDSNFYNNKPGSYWEYSNIAAALAGYIVELKSGKKLNKYSKELLFKPLGMKTSGWFLNEIDRKRHAKLYKNKGDSTIEVPLYEMTTYPDGSLRTSVAELTQFFMMLLNDGVYNNKRILKSETVTEMLRMQFTENHKPENINLTQKNEGIFWRSKSNMTKFGHGGTDFGINVLMLTDASRKTGVVLFTNTDDDKSARSHYLISEALFKYAAALAKKQ